MMKLAMVTMMLCFCLAVMTGCGTKNTDSDTEVTKADTTKEETNITTEDTVAKTGEVDESANTTEEIQEVKPLDTYDSKYGYTVNYDSSIFEVSNSDDVDKFALKNQNYEQEYPVYVCISKPQESPKTLLDGLILQSGVDGVEARETIISENEYPSQFITYEKKGDKGIQRFTFHVVQKDGSTYFFEIGTSDKIEQPAQNAIEEIMATFYIK